MSSYTETAALKSAIELGLFTAVGEGNQDPAAIAKQCKAAERGVRSLCDFLTVCGLLAKTDGRYSLTPESAAFLDRRSPAYMGGAVEFLNSPLTFQAWDRLTDAVRRGGTALQDHVLDPDHPAWETFARAMAPLMAMPAERLAKLLEADKGEPWKVLDIAAGHGIFGITVARHNPNATIYAVDWRRVLNVARGNAGAAGVADRWHAIEGSAFDVDLGKGYDLVLLTNFLHHFDPATCERLLARVHAALKPGGRAAALEFVPNPDRVSPPMAATFSLTMLAMTDRGDAYTFAEYERMFRAAGFKSCEQQPVVPGFNDAILAYR